MVALPSDCSISATTRRMSARLRYSRQNSDSEV